MNGRLVCAALLLGALSACADSSGGPEPSLGRQWDSALAAQGEVHVDAPLGDGRRFLSVEVRLRNDGTEPIAGLAFMACDFSIRVYEGDAPLGSPIWDRPVYWCPDRMYGGDLAPGAAMEESVWLSGWWVDEIMGGRPAGTYFVTVVLRLGAPHDWHKEFAIGPLELPGS